jgi:Stage II sporulation protein M
MGANPPAPRSLSGFTAARGDEWAELGGLVRRAGGRPDRLGPDGVLRLGALYRAAAADLSEARRRFPGDPVVSHLQDLVGSARGLVYRSPGRRGSILSFFRRDYWRLIAERPLPLLIAAVCLLAPAGLAAGWAVNDPPAASGLVPEEYRSVAEPRDRSGLREIPADERAALSSEIFVNNIRVSFLAFAGGIAAGILGAGLLAFNGILLGVVFGLAA